MTHRHEKEKEFEVVGLGWLLLALLTSTLNILFFLIGFWFGR